VLWGFNKPIFHLLGDFDLDLSLSGRIALITGASRGVGKGVALGLGEAGTTVYVTGRSATNMEDAGSLGGTPSMTAIRQSPDGRYSDVFVTREGGAPLDKD
jgi:NAD(P)-dependent dehydrogenase (short-subunit alcohol dehydrogenase family)